ncbi:hypothetical protein MRX96_024819 [Rhipicephalus microplus]
MMAATVDGIKAFDITQLKQWKDYMSKFFLEAQSMMDTVKKRTIFLNRGDPAFFQLAKVLQSLGIVMRDYQANHIAVLGISSVRVQFKDFDGQLCLVIVKGGGSPEGLQTVQPKVVEVVVQLRYSGGPGLQARYCRQLGLALTLEVQPSLLISGWDVLPAQEPTKCHLVLDLRNETDHELELRADNERQPLLLEAKDCCRIPVTVPSWPNAEGPEQLEMACRQHLQDTVKLRWWLISLLHAAELAENVRARCTADPRNFCVFF